MKTRSLLILPPLRWLAAVAALTILVPIARPQSRPVATPPGSDAQRPPRPLEETLVLNPFEVIATSDKSYGALNSNSITAFNTELFKLPISADIFDETFMKDTGMTSAEDMVQNFSAGAGITGPDPSLNAGLNQPGDRNRVAFIQLRGLTTGTPKRDSLMPVGNVNQPGSTAIGFTSTFDIERVEVINGPQALLYGSGGAGGVLNYVSKQARIGKPAFGSVQVQVDSFGGVLGLADFGASTRNAAIRVAVLKQELKTRRDFLGGPVDGLYLQGALRLGNHTTLRLIAEQTTYDKTKSIQYTLNATSTAVDARHGARFDNLMASNQIMQSASGASGAGALLNGALNWDNLNSLGGSWAKDKTVSTLTSVSADTRWNTWLSTKLSAGYYDYHNDFYANTVTIYAPNVAANPLPGHWTYAQTGADPAHDSFQTNRDKACRFLALANNQLFGGRVHSQTAFGADFTRVVLSNINYGLYLADDNWNPVVNPAITTRDGRTAVTPIFWAIDNGPVKDGPFAPNANQVIWQGKKYLRMVQNPSVDSRIAPGNPMGTRLGGETAEQGKVIERGVFGTNYSQWYDNRFDTMVGFRLQDSYYEYFNSGTAPGNISLGSPIRSPARSSPV